MDTTKPDKPLPGRVLAVRMGPGANCSSIGSAVEILFLSATAGAALIAAVSAALKPVDENVTEDTAAKPEEPTE
jgi:hypothetical protein